MDCPMKKPVYARIFNYDKNLLPNNHLKSLEQGVSNIEEAFNVHIQLTIFFLRSFNNLFQLIFNIFR